MKARTVSSPAATPPSDAPTATALKLFVVLNRAHQAIARREAQHLAAHELTIAEFAILEALYHKGPLLLGEVQKKVLVSSGGITFLVDKLTARGLVERQACPSDRRARYAALTAEGTRLMRRLFPAHAAVIREALTGLSSVEQKHATALLKQLGKAAATP
ncbi:MAG: MarR family transcriptional regulator [Gemmatimonadaceae bacterium]|nr:MarR family transcriptional regulator [Gemmatimonadaceae bacterium]